MVTICVTKSRSESNKTSISSRKERKCANKKKFPAIQLHLNMNMNNVCGLRRARCLNVELVLNRLCKYHYMFVFVYVFQRIGGEHTKFPRKFYCYTIIFALRTCYRTMDTANSIRCALCVPLPQTNSTNKFDF